VGSSCQRTEQKAADIQRKALKYPGEWRIAPEEYLKKLQERLSKRFPAVLNNKGNHAKY